MTRLAPGNRRDAGPLMDFLQTNKNGEKASYEHDSGKYAQRDHPGRGTGIS
jgi:hypothetical protein